MTQEEFFKHPTAIQEDMTSVEKIINHHSIHGNNIKVTDSGVEFFCLNCSIEHYYTYEDIINEIETQTSHDSRSDDTIEIIFISFGSEGDLENMQIYSRFDFGPGYENWHTASRIEKFLRVRYKKL